MKLTTTTQVSVDGVMQGNRGPDENRSGGFERGGWARPPKALFDDEAMTFVHEVYQRADARLFPDTGPDIALELVDSRAFPRGITLQVYRPTGRPQYAT
jgi:hypothetical protein